MLKSKQCLFSKTKEMNKNRGHRDVAVRRLTIIKVVGGSTPTGVNK